MSDSGVIDCFRAVHGYRVEESSWFLKRGDKVIGRRFDHVLASTELVPESADYLHEARLSGLSDHSPLEVAFAWRSRL
jgi:exonuclease III